MLHSFFLGTELLTINNLLFKAQIDNINLFKVVSKNHDAVLIHSGCRLLSRFIILILVTEILWEEPDQQKGTGVVLYEGWLLDEINVPPLHLQLGGFVEKYAGSGVTLHPQSSSNKENRRTEGLNRYLQTLQSHQSTATGRGISWVRYRGWLFSWWVKRGLDRNIIIFINSYYLRMVFLHNLPLADQLQFFLI